MSNDLERTQSIHLSRDGYKWCGKDHSTFDEYSCPFCDGTGSFVDSTLTPCDACNGDGHYSDICCEYHAEQLEGRDQEETDG